MRHTSKNDKRVPQTMPMVIALSRQNVWRYICSLSYSQTRCFWTSTGCSSLSLPNQRCQSASAFSKGCQKHASWSLFFPFPCRLSRLYLACPVIWVGLLSSAMHFQRFHPPNATAFHPLAFAPAPRAPSLSLCFLSMWSGGPGCAVLRDGFCFWPPELS